MEENTVISHYGLTYKGVLCHWVYWVTPFDTPLFVFEYRGKIYPFFQIRRISQSADTDHIRVAINQFLEFYGFA